MNRAGQTRALMAAAFLVSLSFLTSLSQAQTCSGVACSDVSLKLINSCVWAENSGSKAVALTLRIGTETLVLPLEGADLAKAKPREPTQQEATQARQCVNVLRSAKMLEDMRARGTNVPFNPEIDGRADFCRKLEASKASPAASTSGPVGVHATVYDAFAGRDRAVFRARIRPANCVPRLADVASYTADYGAVPQRPADK